MFQIQNVPIVIEPGVNVLEAEFSAEPFGRRRKSCVFPVQLFRVEIDQDSAALLPFIPTVRTPHVFSLAQNLAESLVLVVYDSLGRIKFVYTRNYANKTWEKREIADEHAGKTVRQFSIRYFFNSESSRDEFMRCVDVILADVQQKKQPADSDVRTAFQLLSRARVGPVVLPVAAVKSSLNKMRL